MLQHLILIPGIGLHPLFQESPLNYSTGTSTLSFGTTATVCVIPAVIYPADRARGGGIADVLVVLLLCV